MKDVIILIFFACLWIGKATHDLFHEDKTIAVISAVLAAILFNFSILKHFSTLKAYVEKYPFNSSVIVMSMFMIPVLVYNLYMLTNLKNEKFMDVLLLAVLAAVVFNFTSSKFFSSKKRKEFN